MGPCSNPNQADRACRIEVHRAQLAESKAKNELAAKEEKTKQDIAKMQANS